MKNKIIDVILIVENNPTSDYAKLKSDQGVVLDSLQNKKSLKTPFIVMVGLILGVVNLVLWLFPVVGLITASTGLVFSIIGFKNHRKIITTISIILNLVGLLSSSFYMLLTGDGKFLQQSNLFIANPIQYIENKRYSFSIPKNLSLEERRQKFLSEIVEKGIKVSISLPYELDQQTTITKITTDQDTIRYHCILSDTEADQLTVDVLRKRIYENVCGDTNTLALLKQDFKVEYEYFIKQSNATMLVVFTKQDCAQR